MFAVFLELLLERNDYGDRISYFFLRSLCSNMHSPTKLSLFIRVCICASMQFVPALQEVCQVFNYDARYVTLFHQPGSASRFVRQRILLNTEPVYARHFATPTTKRGRGRDESDLARLAESKEDVRRSSFVWCYLYGVLIHKLGHFHDIVHGTRHDYYMNEVRVELPHICSRFNEFVLSLKDKIMASFWSTIVLSTRVFNL